MTNPQNQIKKRVAIIGGGAGGMMCAIHLDSRIYDIHLYEGSKRLGSKMLVAGKGGFNLTHGSPMDNMLRHYTDYHPLQQALQSFSNKDLIEWLSRLGINTYKGSSNRIFPIEKIKPRDVLLAFFDQLASNNVQLHIGHRWIGWRDDQLLFESKGQTSAVYADKVIYALGGSSWKKTGSDGQWASLLASKDIDLAPFASANCALGIDWPEKFIAKNAGKPIKNIKLKYREQYISGELMITDFGLEGSPVYAISNRVGKALDNSAQEELHIDFKPVFNQKATLEKLLNAQSMAMTDRLRKVIKIDKPAVDLIKNSTSKQDFLNVNYLSRIIHAFPISVRRVADLDEAISTSGGIPESEITNYFQLKKLPNHYAIGEMLDWSAPTGGYLLQGTFSMAWYLAKHLNGLK